MHNSITTCMSHYYPRHVSGLDVPILRRNNCTDTASGILALLRGCTLHRLRADCRTVYYGVVYSRLGERGYQMLCLCSFPPEDGHVKAWNMSRIVMWHTCCYWIIALKLVEEIILYIFCKFAKLCSCVCCMTCACRSAPVRAEVFSVPMMQNWSFVIMLSSSAVMGCAADAGFLSASYCAEGYCNRQTVLYLLECKTGFCP